MGFITCRVWYRTQTWGEGKTVKAAFPSAATVAFLWGLDILLCMSTSQTGSWGAASDTCCFCRQQVSLGYDLGHEACRVWSGCKSGWNAREGFIRAGAETITVCSNRWQLQKERHKLWRSRSVFLYSLELPDVTVAWEFC